MYFFIKQTFQIEKKKSLFKCLVYSESISELNICLHLILLRLFQFSVSLIYKFCYIYCCVPTNFQFKILHIFCLHLCSIYFFVHAVKIFLVRIIQFCYLSHSFPHWLLIPFFFFNSLFSLLHLLWSLFLLLSVFLSPHWSLSRTYTFLFLFLCEGRVLCLLAPKLSNEIPFFLSSFSRKIMEKSREPWSS